ncbi:8743_t:CDS:2, partial [Gigaspora margarita]
ALPAAGKRSKDDYGGKRGVQDPGTECSSPNAATKTNFKEEKQTRMGNMTKRAHFMDIVCYESNSKGKSQAGERSSNKCFKKSQVKYAKGEMNLELEPDSFINKI